MNMYESIDWLHKTVQRETRVFFRQASESPYGWYVWYKTGDVKFAQEQPAGYELAFPECIRISMTHDQITRQVINKLQSVPCLPI